MEVREYIDADDRNHYAAWFDDLNAPAAARVAIAITRMALGNLSNTRSIGAGAQEYRIDFGPGYRVYFGRDGDDLVILLAGGSKKGQRRDIRKAQSLWREYKKRKQEVR